MWFSLVVFDMKIHLQINADRYPWKFHYMHGLEYCVESVENMFYQHIKIKYIVIQTIDQK